MPAQPAWFHRLDEILSAPRSMTSTRLDRLAPSDGGARCGGSGWWRIFPKPSRLGPESCGSYLTGHWTWRGTYPRRAACKALGSAYSTPLTSERAFERSRGASPLGSRTRTFQRSVRSSITATRACGATVAVVFQFGARAACPLSRFFLTEFGMRCRCPVGWSSFSCEPQVGPAHLARSRQGSQLPSSLECHSRPPCALFPID